MSCIYKLTFADGRLYVGATSGDPQIRFNAHRRKSKKARSVLYRAWRLLGAPTLEVLAVVERSRLFDEEIKWIAELRTEYPGGYNTTGGGEVSPASSPAVALKISASRKGMIFSAEHRKNLSIAHKGRPSPKRGVLMPEDQKAKLKDAWTRRRLRPDSEETRAKKSAASRGRRHTPEARAKVSEARKAYWAARRSADAATV